MTFDEWWSSGGWKIVNAAAYTNGWMGSARAGYNAALASSEAQAECEVCAGAKGGVPGNENVIDGKRVCDYCHADGSYKAAAQAGGGSKAVTREACQIDNFSSRMCQHGTRSCIVDHAAPPAECTPREALTDDARECLADVVSHYRALYAGLAFQLNEATVTENADDMAYWKHEIRALERMYVQAEHAIEQAAQEKA